jgi:ABC-type multidrug transport system fused ATPase/permease subunit
LGGAKDVKLLGREQSFLKQYAQHNDSSALIWERQTTLQALPRLLLELLAMAGLVALVLIMLGQGKAIGDLIPVLGLFAAAAFRLMPSVNRVLTSAQSLRFLQPVTNKLALELNMFRSQKPTAENGTPLNFKNELKLEQVGYIYEGAPSAALSEVSFSIATGTSVGFVGGSGAGKSTLIDVVLGLLTPTAGKVTVDGTDIQQGLRDWMNRIGYVPQNIYLTDDSLRRNVAFGISADQIDEDSVWRAIRSAQLETFVQQLPQGLDTIVGERGIRLSGGQRQRIGIARALYHDPEVLVLDEATSSLDTATERGVMEAVRALHGHKTILIVAHRLSTVEHCDTIIRLEQGRVTEQGDAAYVLKQQTSA